MAGQQQEEIETIRSRTIEVKLSDADVKRISEKAAAHGLTVGELIENFIGDEEITGTFIQNNQIMDGIFTILWYACYVLCPLNFLQNIIRMVKKDRKFSFLELLLHNRQKKGFEAKLGGDTVALKTAKDLSGVVFGKSNGKYATMPESTDGHILIVGGAGSGKTAAVAIPTLMLMCGKVSQENYVELTAASAMPNKEIKSPQILRC